MAHYTRSTGVQVSLDEMATPHLKSAHAKLARDFPDHPEIGPMAEEIAKRDAEYQAGIEADLASKSIEAQP